MRVFETKNLVYLNTRRKVIFLLLTDQVDSFFYRRGPLLKCETIICLESIH